MRNTKRIMWLIVVTAIVCALTLAVALPASANENANVAKIGDTEYATLDAAIAAAADGDTVTLIHDAKVTAAVTLSGKSITLDLNGMTLTSSATNGISVAADAALTITGNGNMVVTGNYSSGIENSGTLVIENGTFTAVYGAVRALGGSTTTINGGTFESSTERYGMYYWANSNKTALTVTINNGIFKNSVSTTMESGLVTLKVRGGSFANDLSAYCEDGFGTTLDESTKMYEYGKVSSPDSYVEDANGNVTISGENGLIWFAKQVNEKGNTFKGKTVTLAADITLTDTWTPVGVSVNESFRGTFDGAGHTISGMKMSSLVVGEYGHGFFKLIISATVKNVIFDNATVDMRNSNIVGIVAGYSYGSSTFENVHVTSSTVYAYGKVGGMVGMADEDGATTTFTGCSVEDSTIHVGYNGAGFLGLAMGKCKFAGSYLKNNEVIVDENSEGFGALTELDTTVTCDGSVATCAGNGTVIKGRYIPNGNYYYSAYSDLYNHYGDSSHDCTLANGKYLANSEVTHDALVTIVRGKAEYLFADLQCALDFANDGETVKLLADIYVTEGLNINDKKITLDLNGKTIANTADIWDIQPALLCIKNSAVTITGNGKILAKENDCYTINLVSGSLTIENGEYVGNISAVQVEKGTLTINGGTFSLLQKWEGKSTYLINCIDDAFVDSEAAVAIKGGKFVDFDPNNSPEKKVNGVAPSFAAPGVGITKDTDGNFVAVEGKLVQVCDENHESVAPYDNLADAIAAAKDGYTIILIGDTTEDVVIDKNITLDLGGFALTGTGVTGKATLTIANGATATVRNGSINGTDSYYTILNNGTVTLEGLSATAGNNGSSMIDNRGTLTITSGTYTGGLDTVKNEPAAMLTISGGTFTLNKGTSDGFTGVVFNYGTLEITGGEFIQNDKSAPYGQAQVIHTDKSGSTAPSTVIKGGTFKNLCTRTTAWTVRATNAAAGATKVSGGTFNKSVSESYCADGFIPTKNSDGTYGIKEGRFVAKMGSTKYETLAAAIAAAKKFAKTITLLDDVNENVTIAVGQKITLDLNGKTLNGGTGTAVATITNHGTLTIKDSVGGGRVMRNDSGIVGEKSYYVIDNCGGTLTIESGSIYNNSGYEKTNPSGSMVGSSLIRNGGSDDMSYLYINGGTMTQKNFLAVKNDPNGIIAVTGGEISSNHSAVQNWFKATITGGKITGQLWTDSYVEGESVGETTIGGNAEFNGEIVIDITGSIAPALRITGGTLNITNMRITTAAAAAGAKPAVSGGVFNIEIKKEWCVEGFAPKALADGTYGVEQLVKLEATEGVLGESVKFYILTNRYGDLRFRVRITLNGEEVIYNGVDYEKNGTEYYAYILDLPPQYLDADLKIELINNSDEAIQTVNYSFLKYCEAVLNKDTNAKQLVADLLWYSVAAKNKCGLESATLTAKLGELGLVQSTGEIKATVTKSHTKAGEEKYMLGATLYHDSMNRIIILVDSGMYENTIGNHTYTYRKADGTAKDLVKIGEIKMTDGRICAMLATEGIYANEFDTAYTIEVTFNGEVVETLVYSVNNYCETKAPENELAKALYYYGVSAAAYKHS